MGAAAAMAMLVLATGCSSRPARTDSAAGAVGTAVAPGAPGVAAGPAVGTTSGASPGPSTGTAAGASTHIGTTGAPGGAVPKAVDDLGNAGEDLYDAVDARNWRSAQSLLGRVERAAHALPAAPGIQDHQPALTAEIDSLRRALAAHDRLAALEAANQVTYRSARMTEAYAPPTPTEVLLLDYYGREVDIWAAQHDSARLRSTVADLRATWERVKPAVVSHHGQEAARQMDTDVARLEAARTSAEYTRASKPFLDQVDVLEKVFTKQ